ncbi:MAG: response regulator [Deltaproteobacteria bacterium]|nr:response regulator [Deltaproteobacteria bacterium]MBS3919202.1 response regulator [Deltaproteobacteria bacterium]
MKEKVKWAFILDKDEFVRLSLNKILKKYGFQVEEIEDISGLEKRKKDVKGGMILADLEMEGLERWVPLLKRWNDRFILMSPQITDDLVQRLKQIGIHRILKKPVEPKMLRKVIREMSFPDGVTFTSSVKQRGGFPTQSERR